MKRPSDALITVLIVIGALVLCPVACFACWFLSAGAGMLSNMFRMLSG